MKHFEQLALDSTQDKPSLWLRYVDDTFIIWPHDAEKIWNFLTHLNSLRSAIQFTMEIESGGAIPFLDALVTRKGTALTTQVYRKPTHIQVDILILILITLHSKKRNYTQSSQ
jgi:hypothetical protein